MTSGHADTNTNTNTTITKRRYNKKEISTISLVPRNNIQPIMESVVQPEECQTAINLTEYWRSDNSGSHVRPGGGYNCDFRDMNMNYAERPWFRFASDAGNMMLDSCPPSYSCGAQSGLWTNETMPTAVGEAMETHVFGSWADGCKSYKYSILVMRCSYDTLYDYIYKLNVSSSSCYLSFCGMSKPLQD